MNIRRQSLELRPDPRRVLLRPFMASVVVKPTGHAEPSRRLLDVLARVLMLDDAAVQATLDGVLAEFHDRHEDIRAIFLDRFAKMAPLLPIDRTLDESRRLLIGSYFTNEYSLESSALFNPSIVPAPDQSGLDPGELRFVLSLRATGEGHISSVTFRSGVAGTDGQLRLDPVSKFVHAPRPEPAARYDLKLFRRKLYEMGIDRRMAQQATSELPDSFCMSELVMRITRLRREGLEPEVLRAGEQALLLAEANYTVRFKDGLDMSEKVIFPFSPLESNGIEDARFVRFTEDDGSCMYYATYTAYNGSVVFPQILQTRDFSEFRTSTLNGPAVRDKGLALFPRKINGLYAMLGRQDGENIHLMYSDHPHFWYESRVIVRPSQPWEFTQLGNCGSPIETEAGWLVLTHGVGPMRKYCIGAVLLDRDDPSVVIGRLHEPLLGPAPDEREGYVPNVVYSCGSLVHDGVLILPYAVSDTATRFASIPLDELIGALHAE
ncbi:MAG: glycosidase [Chthoniobacterales bacterium]|nr:glycosidase [Chthoniobacterales bacterium]